MSESEDMFYCSFVSIHYIICECGETFPSEEDLKSHFDKAHILKKEKKEYKCGICEELFNTEEECIKHYEQNHMEAQLEEGDYILDANVDDVDLKDNIIIQEFCGPEPIVQEVTVNNSFETKKKVPKCQSRNIVCEICGKKYRSNAALKYHQRVHTGERPYKCTLCDKSFTMPLFLQIHVRTHTGERPYQCPLCPKAFSNRAALLRHSRVHTGVKPYECPRCGKFFTQSNSMKLHVNTVHLKMPAPYKSKTRKLKAQEREMMRNSLLLNKPYKNETQSAAESISQKTKISEGELQLSEAELQQLDEAELSTLNLIKAEVDFKQEYVDAEILYDKASPEVTYEVIYE